MADDGFYHYWTGLPVPRDPTHTMMRSSGGREARDVTLQDVLEELDLREPDVPFALVDYYSRPDSRRYRLARRVGDGWIIGGDFEYAGGLSDATSIDKPTVDLFAVFSWLRPTIRATADEVTVTAGQHVATLRLPTNNGSILDDLRIRGDNPPSATEPLWQVELVRAM